MKKTLILAASAAIAGATVAGCGSSKVQQRVSDEQRMRMDFEFDQYHKHLGGELEKGKQGEN